MSRLQRFKSSTAEYLKSNPNVVVAVIVSFAFFFGMRSFASGFQNGIQNGMQSLAQGHQIGMQSLAQGHQTGMQSLAQGHQTGMQNFSQNSAQILVQGLQSVSVWSAGCFGFAIAFVSAWHRKLIA